MAVITFQHDLDLVQLGYKLSHDKSIPHDHLVEFIEEILAGVDEVSFGRQVIRSVHRQCPPMRAMRSGQSGTEGVARG